jgi:hypothetical protein
MQLLVVLNALMDDHVSLHSIIVHMRTTGAYAHKPALHLGLFIKLKHAEATTFWHSFEVMLY